jgi:hypothetical protein
VIWLVTLKSFDRAQHFESRFPEEHRDPCAI